MSAVASTSSQPFGGGPSGIDLAARQAASKEREERLNNARKKLKTYRAKQAKIGGSTSSFTSSLSTKSSKRDSIASSSVAPASPINPHRRSQSRSSILSSALTPSSPARTAQQHHARRVSRSKGSRSSISFPSHGHSRSRASISLKSGAPYSPDKGKAVDRSSTDTTRLMNGNALPQINLATSPNPPSRTAPNHGRRASRHSRQLSVSNFRESLEIVSGQGTLTGALKPAASSFAPPGTSPSSSPSMNDVRTTPTLNGWSNDPERVLQALKERGRLEDESAHSDDPYSKRNAALEALEGKLSAPSPVIDLGTASDDMSNPAFADAATPTMPSAAFGSTSSPLMAMNLNGNRRSSWGLNAPAASSMSLTRGPSDLGMLIEEEEETDDLSQAVDDLPESPRRKTPKKRPEPLRPSSLASPPRSRPPATEGPISMEQDPSTSPSSFAPKRLSLTPTATSPVAGQPSPLRSPNTSRNSLRELSLSPSIGMARSDSNTSSNADDKKRSSLLYSTPGSAASAASSLERSRHAASGGSFGSGRASLRTLSVGQGHLSQDSPRAVSPTIGRRAASIGIGNPSTSSKRSSISYRNTSDTVGQRRTWRNTSVNPPAAPVSPSDGPDRNDWTRTSQQGAFGDLVQDDADEAGSRRSSYADTPLSPSRILSPTSQGTMMSQQLLAVRNQLEHLRLETSQLSATHALEIAEFEKKASDEAVSMRARIEELERDVEEVKLARKFEVEGLSRELEQAKEVVQDLTDERDSLREDVEGWRKRCASLEKATKKDREEDNLAKAQAKLINEMRDQIYNLVAALERERTDHAETKREVDRLVSEQAATLNVVDHAPDTSRLPHRHFSQANSDVSLMSSSSFSRSYSGNTTEDTSVTTDIEDASSMKTGSPTSAFYGHSQPLSRRGSELGGAAALGSLQTLEEEEEEEDELTQGTATDIAINEEDELIRGQSAASTMSTDLSEMPPTPSNDRPISHARSGSFVRHWSFPKGSVQSARTSTDEEHIFFDLGRHTSLPALPIPEHILPPFLGGDLTIEDDADDESETPGPQHIRRPSSPRPLDRMQRHSKRFSGQFASRGPPVAPSAFASAALAQSAPASSTPVSAAPQAQQGRLSGLYRLSFGNIIGSLGGWTPSATTNPPLPMSVAPTTKGIPAAAELPYRPAPYQQPPPPQQVSPRTPRAQQQQQQRKYVQANQQPTPRSAPLSKLNFMTACCEDDTIFVV